MKDHLYFFNSPFVYTNDETSIAAQSWEHLVQRGFVYPEHADHVPNLLRYKLGHVPLEA